MDIEENLNFNNELNNNLISEKDQNNFIESRLGQVINTGLDIGLRYILPDFLENEIIDVKDTILKNGFKDGLKLAINSAINIGKGAIGIATGKFENVSQVQAVIRNGGLLDSASNLINSIVNKTVENGKISYSIGNIIKQGKNVLISNISKNIENEFESQLDNVEKLSKYSNNWKTYFKDKDFNGMEKEYIKIEEKIKKVMPIENTIKEVRIIENLHNLIKAKGENFNLSNEEIELAKML